MSNKPSIAAIENTLVQGDLSKLTAEQRVAYYNAVCTSVGLNPLTKPFEYITLNNKLQLYARKDATDQLRAIHEVSVIDLKREMIGDLLHVTVTGETSSGKKDVATGALVIKGLSGEALANAYMKCETKAKRRLTLSICGLGLLDETEVESVKREVGETKAAAVNALLNGAPAAETVVEPEPESAAAEPEVDPFADEPVDNDPGDHVVAIGNKFRGKRLKDLNKQDVQGYVDWIRKSPVTSRATQEFLEFADAYLEQA